MRKVRGFRGFFFKGRELKSCDYSENEAAAEFPNRPF